VAELVEKGWMRRIPAELGSSLGRVNVLIEQEDLGEIVAQACPSLIIGTGDRSWSAGCDRGRLGELGNG
jgi:hypothetical protein